MYKYISHFTENSILPLGVTPSQKDIHALQELIREFKMLIVEEKWIPKYGYRFVWESPILLNEGEQEVLCVKKI